MYSASQSPPSSSSRGQSLDYASRGPSLDSAASDPFVDRSLYDPSLSSTHSHSSNSRSSSRVREGQVQVVGRNPWSPLSSEHGDSPPPPSSSSNEGRPGLPHSTSGELSRQISAALSEDLPPPNPTVDHNYSSNGNGNGNGSGVYQNNGRKRSESGATLKARGSGTKVSSSPSFLSQFRSGSGWFAPMVEPEQPLSREEYAAKEKERIEKLKAGKSSQRRPGLMKRLSSGLELSGFGGSPTKR